MKLVMTPESVNWDGYIDTQTECGKLYFYRVKSNRPGDYPAGRPWHLVGMGWFAESPEALFEMLKSHRPDKQESTGSYTGYGFNTHAPSYN